MIKYLKHRLEYEYPGYNKSPETKFVACTMIAIDLLLQVVLTTGFFFSLYNIPFAIRHIINNLDPLLSAFDVARFVTGTIMLTLMVIISILMAIFFTSAVINDAKK